MVHLKSVKRTDLMLSVIKLKLETTNASKETKVSH